MKHMIFIWSKYLECYFPSLKKNPKSLEHLILSILLGFKDRKFKNTVISSNTCAFDDWNTRVRNYFTWAVHLPPQPWLRGAPRHSGNASPGEGPGSCGMRESGPCRGSGRSPGSPSTGAALRAAAPSRAGRARPAPAPAASGSTSALAAPHRKPPVSKRTRSSRCSSAGESSVHPLLSPPAAAGLAPGAARLQRGVRSERARPRGDPEQRRGRARQPAPRPTAPARGQRRRHVKLLWARDPDRRSGPAPQCGPAPAVRERGHAARPGPAARCRRLPPRPAPRRRRRRPAGHEAPPAPERCPASRLLSLRPPRHHQRPSRPRGEPPSAPLPPHSRRHVGPGAAAGPPLSPGACEEEAEEEELGPRRPAEPSAGRPAAAMAEQTYSWWAAGPRPRRRPGRAERGPTRERGPGRGGTGGGGGAAEGAGAWRSCGLRRRD